MAKKKGKSKSKKKGDKRVANRAMLGTFAGGLMGKVVEKVLADGIKDHVLPVLGIGGGDHHRRKHRDRNGADREDVAAKLLTALADGGPKPIPLLLADTKVGLSPMLHALQTLRDFRLINFVGEPGGETVEVTRSGAETATVFRKNHIREEATKLLEG